MPESPLGIDLTLISNAIKKSIAPKTWIDYSIAWKRLLDFKNNIGLSGFPPSEQTILAFLCTLFQSEHSYSRINIISAGVSFFFKLYHFPACNTYFTVRQALKGYKLGNLRPDAHRPITVNILKVCLATSMVCSSDYESLLFHTAFILMFFAALRISELLPDNKLGLSGLGFPDVVLSDACANIFISSSKTDVSGRGQWLSLQACGDSIICPVLILRKYLSKRPSVNGNFLVHINGVPLTKFQFSAVFKRCLAILGLAQFKFSSHSFRIGAATEAARLGLDVSLIKRLGRWDSHRFGLYIRPNLSL